MATAAPVTHEVVRRIPGMGLAAGDRVDASGWRNAEKLVRTRYLKPIEDVAGLREKLAQAQRRIDELEQENARLRESTRKAAVAGGRK